MLRGDYKEFIQKELIILRYRYNNHEERLQGLLRYIENDEFAFNLPKKIKSLKTKSNIKINELIKLNSVLEELRNEGYINYSFYGFQGYFSDFEIKILWKKTLSEFICIIELLEIYNLIRIEKHRYPSLMEVFTGVYEGRKEFTTNKLTRESRLLQLQNTPRLEIDDWLKKTKKPKKFQPLINLIEKING